MGIQGNAPSNQLIYRQRFEESINEPINESVKAPINESNNVYIEESTNQSAHGGIEESINQRMGAIGESIRE